MTDDLANSWGTGLCLPEKYRRSLVSPRHLLPQNVARAGIEPSPTGLPVLVSAETNDFVFGKIADCGSQANSWAIDDATNQNASACLFAAGSYVAGDGSVLQQYSTSEFDTGVNLCEITPPKSRITPACRANTVPLPYHIPGVMTPHALEAYEDECLQKVHIQLCWAKTRGHPYKALLLELMLAGNGASLSDRALVCIGMLAAKHQLRVIVDEIMTGGRTGRMFYLLSKPSSFQAVVTHITFGKWTQMGIVFFSKAWAEKREKLYPFTKRGASTSLGEDRAVVQWKCLKACLSETAQKRAKVLQKLRLREQEVWGEGLLLFGPCRRETMCGLKCRYLPTIHAATPIDKGNTTKLMPTQIGAYRAHVNKLILEAIKLWISDVPQALLDPNGLTPAEQHRMNAERSSDFALISKLIKGSSETDEKTAEEWRKLLMPNTNRSQGEGALRRVEAAGYMIRTQVGKKRTRNWKLQDGFIAPWKSEDQQAIVL